MAFSDFGSADEGLAYPTMPAVVNLLAAQPDSVPNLSKDSEASWQLPKRYLDAVGSSFVPFVADGIAIETQLQQQP